jgi:hypothetical protein
MFVVLAVLSAIESARTIATPYHTHTIASAIIACVALTFVVDLPRGLTGKRARWLCVAAILAVCLASAAVRPKKFDVSDASIFAVKAILMAHNPYAVDLDRGSQWNTGNAKVYGNSIRLSMPSALYLCENASSVTNTLRFYP